MSTDLNSLNNNDSNIVNEILDEMNNNNNTSQIEEIKETQPPPIMQKQVRFNEPDLATEIMNHQIDPNVQLNTMNNNNHISQQQEQQQMPQNHINQMNNIKDIILQQFKQPILICILIIIVFSPIVGDLLKNNVPYIFSESTNMKKYLALVLKAGMTSSAYFVLNNII